MSNTNIIPQNILMLNNEELAHHNTASSLDYKDWDTNDVQAWIEEHLKMPQYKEVFSNLCIDGSLLDHITDVDLQNDFSIQVRLHRVKIIQGIQKLQKQAQSITEQQQIQYQQQQQLQVSSNSNNHNINYQQNSQQMQLISFNKQALIRIIRVIQICFVLSINSIDFQLYILNVVAAIATKQLVSEFLLATKYQFLQLKLIATTIVVAKFKLKLQQQPYGSLKYLNLVATTRPTIYIAATYESRNQQQQFQQCWGVELKLTAIICELDSISLEQFLKYVNLAASHIKSYCLTTIVAAVNQFASRNDSFQSCVNNLGMNNQQQIQQQPSTQNARVDTPPHINQRVDQQMQQTSMIGGAQQNSPAHEILVLKAVEGQLLNNVYIVGENGASLGRHSASNDIVISESFVSRRHCEIKYMPNSSEVDQNTVMSGPQNADSNLSKFHMRDIGSTTGTFIMVRNEVLLKQNMMFQMGLSEFKVVLTSKKDMIELHVFEGPSRNKIVPVDSYGLGIGRDQAFISLIQQQEGCVNDPELVAQQILGNVNKANSFCVQDDSQMSNYHARITFYKAGDGRQEGFYLQDVGSTNRTWLRLSSEGEQSSLHPLRINDILKIGSTVFVVQTNDPQNFKNMPVINRRLAVQNMYINSALNEEEKSNINGNQMIIDKGPNNPINQDVIMQQNQMLQNQQLPNSLFRNSSPRGGQNQNLTYINTALDSAMGIPSQNQNPYNQISSTNNAQISNSAGQASSQDSTCKICYEQDGNAAFIPCGHNFACVECAQKCTRCPVCREPFDDIIKIPKDLIKCF